MISEEFGPPANRTCIDWWLFILILVVAAAFIVYFFAGMVALSVFGYW